MFNVFLSYNREDGDIVFRIAKKLKQARIEPWLDKWCLTPGKPWQEEMALGLYQSSACAVFVGPADLGDWEREELSLALDRAVKERGFRIFLVLLPGLPEPFDVTKLSPFLSTRTWVDFRGGFQSTRRFQPLINAIQGVPSPPQDRGQEDQTLCPYRGLQVFNEEHARWYFGRNGEIQRILEKLKNSRFLAIIGPSGSGKSSLARAGLIPRIRDGALPGSDTWLISILCPGTTPLAALSAFLLRVSPEKGMTQTVDSLYRDPRTLHLATALALSQKPSATQLFLLIDQFEEIFTLCSSESERKQFLENLAYAGSQPGGKLTVVLTMRADFYPKCATYPDFSTRLASHQFLVSPMNEDGLRQAIEAPAHLMDHQFEEGLVDTILRDISTQPGSLPLLEHALMELWERRRGSLLTLEGYREIGGIEGALAQRANSIFTQFSKKEQEIVKRLMLRLTQPGEGTEDTRRRTEISQLTHSHSEQSMLDDVIHTLVNSRLLTVSRDETTNEDNLIEVSHEALIRGWPQLRKWIDADRDGIREHHRINEAAQEWMNMSQDEAFLFRGLRLGQALEWSTLHDDQLNEDERKFLSASQEQLTKEEQTVTRRRQKTVAGLLIAFLLISVAAMTAFWEREKAEGQKRIAFSRELAAQASTQFDRDPELSLLLAKEGIQISSTMEVQSALYRAINFSPIRKYFKGHQDSIWSSAFHPDNTKVVTASDDRTARLFDVVTGDIINTLPHDGAVNVVKVSPNGQWIVSGGNDATVKIWSGRTGELYSVFDEHQQAILEANFSPDSQLLATASRDHSVIIWDLKAKKKINHFKKHGTAVTYCVFSPDGKLVASSSKKGIIFLWDPQTGRVSHTLTGHQCRDQTCAVWMLDFHPSGHMVASASLDGTAKLWALDRKTPPISLDHGGQVYIARFSPDGDAIVTAGTRETVIVWNIENGKPLSFLKGHSNRIYTTEFSPNGRWILTASFDGTAKIWDWRPGPLAREVETLKGHKGRLHSGIFSPDGKWIFTAGQDEIGRLWRNPDQWYRFKQRPANGRTTNAVFFGTEKSHIVTANSRGILSIITPEQQNTVEQFQAHGQKIKGLAIDISEKLVYTGSLDGTVNEWNLSTGEFIRPFPDFDSAILSIAFNPSTHLLAIGFKDGTAKIFKKRFPFASKTLSGHSNWITGVAINPNGNLVATVSLDGMAKIWDSSTGANMKIFSGHEDGINSVAFSPNGKFLLTASEDHTARLWDIGTGKTIQEFWGHSGSVHSAEFHSDRKLMVTASEDRTVRIWDVETGKSLLEYDIYDEAVQGASFHPKNDEILSFSKNGTIRIFAFNLPESLDELLQLANERVNRELSQREIRAFLPSPTL